MFNAHRRTDGQTDGRTDMMKLIVAFRNFENAPNNMKKRKLKLKYNYSIKNDFPSKTTPSTYPTQCSLGQIRPTYYFSKKIKRRETIKIIPHLAFILVPKNCPTTKIIKEKYILWSRKG
jgi:hypothetical protein